ncbi:hypothetical protein BD309DRAFT_481991 [Dichomitus squalens]|nr:hypothetical protein BD309DRAFT_481991 [Dichomitus squalens]
MSVNTSVGSDLTVLELVEVLADKVSGPPRLREIWSMSTADIKAACNLLSGIHISLRYILNSRIRINTLPHEILRLVFSFVPRLPDIFTKQDPDLSICSPIRIRTVWDILPVSQVCRQWRDLITSDSTLWSSAFLTPPRRGNRGSTTSTMISHLARFNPASLHVYIKEEQLWRQRHTCSQAEHHGRELLTRYAPRICELCADIPLDWEGDDPPCLLLPMNAVISHTRNLGRGGRACTLSSVGATCHSALCR